eukprot:5597469-Pyramimonas_sp.AAC.1
MAARIVLLWSLLASASMHDQVGQPQPVIRAVDLVEKVPAAVLRHWGVVDILLHPLHVLGQGLLRRVPGRELHAGLHRQ